jgi:predicted ArsR family transcriptional regulator
MRRLVLFVKYFLCLFALSLLRPYCSVIPADLAPMDPTRLSSRFLDSTRGQIATLLRRGVQTVEELAAALGLTDNAVRNHLASLERDGIVRQGGVRRGKGAGKPAVLYELHPAAEVVFSRAYQPVLGAVLDVLVDELPAEQAAELLDKVGRRVGLSVGGRASGTLEARVAAAAAALRALGGEIDVVAEGETLQLRATGCPLSAMVARRPETCRAVESFVSEIVGEPVRECCTRGERPRCCFTVQPAA